MPGPINHRQLPAEQWQKILQQAISDFHTNRQDTAAYDAIHDATEALKAYDTDEANQPRDLGALGTWGQRTADVMSQGISGPIRLATGIASEIPDNPETQQKIRFAGNALAGSLDPETYLSPEEHATVEHSRDTHKLADQLGIATGILGVPTALLGKRIIGRRMAKTDETLRGLRLDNSLKEQQLNAPVRETNPLVQEKLGLQIDEMKRKAVAAPKTPDADVVEGRKLSNEGKKITNKLRQSKLKSAPEAEEQAGIKSQLMREQAGRQARKPDAQPKQEPSRKTSGHDISSNLAAKAAKTGKSVAKKAPVKGTKVPKDWIGQGKESIKPKDLAEETVFGEAPKKKGLSKLKDKVKKWAKKQAAEERGDPTAGREDLVVEIPKDVVDILNKHVKGGAVSEAERAMVAKWRKSQDLPDLTIEEWNQ